MLLLGLGLLVSYRPLASGGVARCLNRDDEGKLEVIYKNRWEGILGVVLGLGTDAPHAVAEPRSAPMASSCSTELAQTTSFITVIK